MSENSMFKTDTYMSSGRKPMFYLFKVRKFLQAEKFFYSKI